MPCSRSTKCREGEARGCLSSGTLGSEGRNSSVTRNGRNGDPAPRRSASVRALGWVLRALRALGQGLQLMGLAVGPEAAAAMRDRSEPDGHATARTDGRSAGSSEVG